MGWGGKEVLSRRLGMSREEDGFSSSVLCLENGVRGGVSEGGVQRERKSEKAGVGGKSWKGT